MVIEDWTVLGLSPDDVAVYQALLRDPSLRADEIEAAYSLASPTASEAMARLAALGLIRCEDRSRVDRVTDPVLAIGRLAGSLRSQIDELEMQAGDPRQVSTRGQTPSDPAEMYDVCVGAGNIAARLGDLVDNALLDVTFCDSPPYTDVDRGLSAAEISALQRGVRMRVLHGQQAFDDADHVTALEEGVRLGLTARTYRDLDVKLAIIDGHTAVLPLVFGHEEAGQCAVFVTHHALVTSLQLLFDFMWRRARPSVASEPSLDSDGDRLGTIVDLLSAGFSDAAIARYLEISEPTLRRRVRRLEQRLGASNRFQLALAAQREGLVAPAPR